MYVMQRSDNGELSMGVAESVAQTLSSEFIVGSYQTS
jgi:hypothetical protein